MARKSEMNHGPAGGPADYQRLSRETLETALAEVPAYASWRRFNPDRKSRWMNATPLCRS